MKKITLMFFMSLLPFISFAQLAEEGFETGWTLANTGTGTTQWFYMQNGVGLNIHWAQGAANSGTQPAFAGQRAAYLQRETVGAGIPEDYLVTPVFNVPQSPELHFYSRLTLPGNQGSIYKVFILNLTANPTADINSPASYTELQSWNEDQINPVQTDYYEKVVVIPDTYVGADVRIAFMMAGNNMDRWLIDNVKVSQKCLPPLNLTAENLNLTTADVSWENPGAATGWDIEIALEGAVPTGIPTVTFDGPASYTFTNLLEDTCYKYYVRAKCPGGGVSEWVGAYYFCTIGVGDDCSAPIVINTLPYSKLDNTANYADHYEGQAGTGCNTSPWENYLQGNDVVFQYTATFTGEINIDLTDNGPYSGIFVYNECSNIGTNCLGGGIGDFEGNPVSLENFSVTAGEDYIIVISTYIESTTPFMLTIQAVACDEPENLSIDNIGMTSAELSWDNPTGATSWGLAVQPAGTGVPQGAGSTVTDNTDYLATGLTASTAYEYWVRADCGNGTFSAWAGPFRFNTMICEVADQCAFTFTMWDMWDTWNGHTMAVKQNGITIATLTGPGSDGEPVEQIVPVCNDMPVSLFWNTGGSEWGAQEIGVSVKNSFGQTIYTKNPGSGVQNTELYQVIVDCDQPYCLPPGGLTASNATETTVDLGWEGSATGEWEYYIVPEGDPAPTAQTTGTLTTSNPTIGAGPLVASTNYEYYVRMHCENSSTALSEWGGPFAFSSSVCPPADKCNYTFILNAPWDGWDDVLLTVRQNNTNVALLGPSFTSGETMTVTVPLCSNIPFEVFWNTDGGWGGQVGLEIINNFDQTLFEQPIYSNAFAGSVLFSTDIDCDHPACLPPTGLTASNGTMTSIDLAWDGPATGAWEYVVVPAGAAAPTPATPGVATASNPAVAVPLAAPATNYEYYVRVVCDGAATPTSQWAGPYAIHSEACDPDDKCVFHFELLSENGYGFDENTMTVYQSGVPAAVLGPDFTWSSPDGYSMIVDVPLCPGLPVEIVWNNGGFSAEDKGLHVYSPYWEDVYVKDFGEGNPGDTLFEGIVTCDPPACIKPWDLAVSDIQLNSVELSWNTQGSTATSWEVWVVPYGAPAPDPATTPGTVVNTNPYVWTGLTSGTPYQYYIRANCEGDGYSTLTGPKAFVTAIENDDCADATGLTVATGILCDQPTGGTISGGSFSGIYPSCEFGEPVSDVWYSFTATSQNQVVAIGNTTGASFSYAVFANDCGNLEEVACEMPVYPSNGATGVVSGLTVGEQYYVMVYSTYIPDPDAPTAFDICISTPSSITVDTVSQTVPEIVQQALVVETCASLENITWSTGTDFGLDVNGIGYFEKGESNFGIDKGVVLMTGYANQAPGPNLGEKLADGGWQGDAQLFDYMTGLGIDVGSYNDATILEFDFTPLANKLRFPFVFASEEYGTYQCGYSDAFAFFLTPVDADGQPTGETTNLAVVPGTNAPVSVVTIRDGNFSPEYEPCISQNENYFAEYFGSAEVVNPDAVSNPLLAPINFEGYTVKMTAESDVVPQQKYHIKLVIADRLDSVMDSAVFIGAFDIGTPDLGEDLIVADGNGICANESFTIQSNLDPEDYTFQWSVEDENGVAQEIEGATGADYTATESGTYSVIASFGGVCTSTDEITIEFYPAVEVVTGAPQELIICDADGFGTFNLSDNTAVILAPVANPANYIVSYHATAQDAQDNANALPLTGYDNVTPGVQEIFVRIEDEKGCLGFKSFNIVVEDRTPAFTIEEDFAICENSQGTITVTPTAPANFDPANATYSWTLDGNALAFTQSSITVTEAGVYEVVVDNGGCTASDSVTVEVIPTPIADAPINVTACGSYELPALSTGNTYYTGPGATGTALSAGENISSTQTLYVYAGSSVSTDCFSENSFIVTIVPKPVVSIAESCQGNDYILEAMFDEEAVYNADNVTFAWVNEAGDNVGTDVTLTVTEPGKYFLTVTPAGIDIACSTTVEAQIDNTTCLIPRGISPNNDGLNDNFDLSTLNVKKLEIFNRYGQEVYSRNNYKDEFIGQGSNGDELPTGTYFYMIERQSGETKTGWVYINRQE